MTMTRVLRSLMTYATIGLLLPVVVAPVSASAQTGDVFVVLQTDPDGTVGSFSFSHTFGNQSNPVVTSPFSLMDGRLQVFNRVQPGVYGITLSLQNGWMLVAGGDG